MQSGAKKASIYLGVFLAVVMIAGVFLPYLNQSAQQTTTSTQPTDTVIPTFPLPPADMSTISFDKVYLHPSGIFTIGQPDGFNASPPNKGATIAQVNLVNNDMFSVVDAYVEAVPITSDQLSDHFNHAAISASWTNFNTWVESSRQTQGDRLVIDFTVTLSGRTYVARQIAWTDDEWIYTVRVLVPENATDLLRYLLDHFVQTLQAQTEFKGTPFDWNGYYDPDASHIIRYPSTWTVTDSAPGRPTSISSPEGSTVLRVESRANTSVADAAAASAFVQNERSGNTVMTVQPVTRDQGQGFSVSYSYTTVDGSQESGLAVLLNGPDGALHVADLRFSASNIDLNQAMVNPTATAEATAEISATATPNPAQAYIALAEVMGTFYVIPPLNLSTQSLPATPTPAPALPPTFAITFVPSAEATSEATSTAEVTSEATAAATEASTPEATATAEVTTSP